MGGGGGGQVMETTRLSAGALEAMWRQDGLRPVLQLADAPRMAAADTAGRYRVALSDGGAHRHPGMLAASLNRLVARGELRRGTVVRVLEYFAGFSRAQRVIFVIQLEILHAECALIRSPTIFEANASQHIGVSCSGGLAIHEPCLMPAQSTIDAKMQQLSLNDQNARFTVTATGDAFGPLGNSCASAMLASCQQGSPGLSGAIVVQLTPNAVMAISEHADGYGMLQPVLQVLDWRMVSNFNNPSTERFRMVLSDGVYTIQSMLATSLNSLLWDGFIKNGSIIHLQEFTCNTMHNRRFIILLKLHVLQSECNIMGNPKPYEMRNQPNEQVTNLVSNAENEPPLCITPVRALNPYQTRWKIKARVTAKTDLRHYNSPRGLGKVFSFDLLDGQGGEIRATCFNARADQFCDLIEANKVYLISEGLVKPAQKFSSLNHEYEITLDHKTSIELCFDDDDDDSNIPKER